MKNVRNPKEESYLPSRDEIRGACQRIRAGWSEPERRRRSAWLEPPTWKVPVVNLPSSLQGDLHDD